MTYTDEYVYTVLIRTISMGIILLTELHKAPSAATDLLQIDLLRTQSVHNWLHSFHRP